jgi:hypothetical protein
LGLELPIFVAAYLAFAWLFLFTTSERHRWKSRVRLLVIPSVPDKEEALAAVGGPEK